MKKIMTALVIALALPAFAAVTGTDTRVEYTGDGSATAYTFTFKTLNTAHVEVYLGGVKQVAGYTVTLNANQDSTPGGTVTFLVAPLNETVVRIQRVTPKTQTTVLTPYSPFKAKTVEHMVDAPVMQTQEVDRRVADAETTHATDKATQASEDAARDALITTLLSTTPSGAVSVNVKDFGAKGDGSTDDAVSINLADSTLPTGGTLYFPPGTYISGSTLTPTSGHSWVATGGKVVIKKKANTDTVSLVNVTGAAKVVLDGLVFDGNKANQPAQTPATTILVKINASTDVTVRNCEFLNWQSNIVRVTGTTRLIFQGNHVAGGEGLAGMNGVGLLIGGDGAAQKDIIVTSNTFEATQTPYWSLFETWESGTKLELLDGLVFSNNTVRQRFVVGHINAAAVTVQGGTYNFAVTGNVVLGGSIGISIAGVKKGTVAANYVEAGDVSNYSIPGTDAGKFLGIEITADDDVAVTGNTVKGRSALGTGITLTNYCNRISVVGNHVSENGNFTYARPLSIANATNVLIANNLVDGTGSYDYSIVGVAALTDVEVVGNLVVNGPQGGIWFQSGSPTRVGLTVNSNRVTGAATTYAIKVENYSNLSIQGNAISASVTYPIVIQSSNGAGDPMTNVKVRDNVVPAGGQSSVWLGSGGGDFTGDIYIEATGTAVPAAGYHPVGYTMLRTNPTQQTVAGTSYTSIGWKCVTAGTPGTFVDLQVPNQANAGGQTTGNPTNGGSVTPNANWYTSLIYTAGAAVASFTVNAPTGGTTGEFMTVMVKNSSGGALAVTWDAAYKMATWTNPANGFGRSIRFLYNGTTWVEVSRSASDVPN